MGSTKTLLRKYHRNSPRVNSLRSISLSYEGHSEEVAARPPDVSTHGMFINTSRGFPEGAVLNLRFLLSLSGVEIQTRCEVRYCLQGVGVGVEFVGIAPEAVREIEREIQLCAKQPGRKERSRRKS
jgi:PilZ domain